MRTDLVTQISDYFLNSVGAVEGMYPMQAQDITMGANVVNIAIQRPINDLEIIGRTP